MKSKKLFAASLVAGTTVLAQLLPAQTVTVNMGPYSSGSGGEYDAIAGHGLTLGNYSSYTAAGGGFETFCVESSVYFSPGTAYTYSLGQTLSTPSGQPLTLGAAYLYYQFATGTLPGYDFANASGQRLTDAGELQAALWSLEGGQMEPGSPISGTTGNPYYADAIAMFGIHNVGLPSDGDFNVDVLQLWQNKNDTGPAQDQLVLVAASPASVPPSVPDGGATAISLILGMAGLAAAGWNFRKASA